MWARLKVKIQVQEAKMTIFKWIKFMEKLSLEKIIRPGEIFELNQNVIIYPIAGTLYPPPTNIPTY